MDGFFDGLGFAIRLVMLLFTWLAVAMFVSPELAALMGLLLIVVWAFIFLPLNLLRELVWQKRQRQIMTKALTHAPAPYQPGSALPPPPSSGGLTIINDTPGSQGAVDVYRELPTLPELEPRSHMRSFWKSLSLPVVGMLMFLGATNDAFMHMLLEARGMTVKPPIAWDQLVVPPPLRDMFADRRTEMEAAARMTLRREGGCAAIVRGRVEPENQFADPASQLAAMKDGRYVYVFDCLADARKPESRYTTWITPEDLYPPRLRSLLNSFSQAPKQEAVQARCIEAANALLAPLHSKIAPPATATPPLRFDPARSPYGGYARLIASELMVRNGAVSSTIVLNCFTNRDEPAQVRFGQ